MILWESLSLEDQKKCLTELRNDTNWVIWCKAKPKDMVTQIFQEYGKCIFDGKRAKPKQAVDNQAESSGGRHVTRARSWWKRGDVDACAAQTNMQCWVRQDILFAHQPLESFFHSALLAATVTFLTRSVV